MPAQIPDSIADWSTTAGSNQPSGSANVGPDLDDNLRAMQVAVRQTYTRGSIASAATCDIGTVDAELITVTGTTGISSLGTTLGATGYGVHKLLTFAGALTLTHSASLACITSANITTVAGDSCMVEYSASGWTMLWYARKSGRPLDVSFSATDGTVSAPGISFSSDTDNGLYRIGANNWAAAAGGVKVVDLTATTVTVPVATTSTGTLTATNAFSAGTNRFRIESTGAMNWLTASGGTTGTHGIVSGSNVVDFYGHETGGGRLSMSTTGVALYSGTNIPLRFITAGTGSVQFSKSGVGEALRWRASTGHLCVVETIGQPALTSGAGSGASIDGTDQAFKITLGSGSGTTIRVTFAQTWANPPIVIAQYQGSHIALRCDATTTLVDIIAASSTSSGDKIDVWCIGQEAS